MRAVVSAVVGESARVEVHAVHRHTTHEHEHEFESAPGLPEPLPAGERVLWQGAPDWKMLARECFHVRKLAVYFAILVAWRVATLVHSGADTTEVLIGAAVAIVLATTALGLALLMAWMSARTTLYTITDRRVVMRVGIVLSVTFNLPFTKIESAGLHGLPADHGDIALALSAENRIAYPHLWPHVRPWHVARTQPSLRAIPGAADVAERLTAAWREVRRDAAAVPAVASRNMPPLRTVPYTSSMHPADAGQAA